MCTAATNNISLGKLCSDKSLCQINVIRPFMFKNTSDDELKCEKGKRNEERHNCIYPCHFERPQGARQSILMSLQRKEGALKLQINLLVLQGVTRQMVEEGRLVWSL